MNQKKVIITGVTGQSGSYMAEYLIENTDYNIIGTTRRTSQPILSNLSSIIDNPRFKLEYMDLCDEHSIRKIIQQEKPEFFLNFGASAFVPDSWNTPALCMQTNTTSLIHILEAIKDHVPSCKVYSAGSSEQWGNVDYSPQDEKHPQKPRSIYGVSKCASELVCKVYRESYGLFIVHGISLNHESPRRQLHYVTRKITSEISRIAHSLEYNKPFDPMEIGNIFAKRDWSHAKDFVRAIWLMLNQDKPKKYVLSSNETHTVYEFIDLCFKYAKIPYFWALELEPGIYDEIEALEEVDKKDCLKIVAVHEFTHDVLIKINPKFFRKCEVELLHGNSDLARKELGWQPEYTFKKLIEEMMENDLQK